MNSHQPEHTMGAAFEKFNLQGKTALITGAAGLMGVQHAAALLESGAHVVVAGSHKSKSLRMKWASTRQPDRRVLGRYGVDKIVVLEGKAGFGFFEDPACFHKVLPPLKSNRLLLQLRYS